MASARPNHAIGGITGFVQALHFLFLRLRCLPSDSGLPSCKNQVVQLLVAFLHIIVAIAATISLDDQRSRIRSIVP